jgi:glycine betaine/proline transport system substrate-binding protein
MTRRNLAAFLALLAALGWAAPARAQIAEPDVRIGWTAWADAEIVSKMAAIILQQGMGYDVELTLSDISVQYRGVAEGDLDAMLMSWQPGTHEDYLARYDGALVDAGPLYAGARLGWAVPAYIPESEAASIADLADPAVAERLGGTITGIDPAAGLMRLSRRAIEAYGLPYELSESTGPAMALQLGEAIEAGEWIVVTAWTPHWIFAEYDLRFLEDPQGVMGGAEAVHAMVRAGFREEQPEIFGFFQRMDLSLEQLQGLMAEARRTSARDAIYAFVEANRDQVQGWMGGP